MPPRLEVVLIPESDRRARRVPPWIVGLALEPAGIVIFHERVLRYPYDSLESVFRHEGAPVAVGACRRPAPSTLAARRCGHVSGSGLGRWGPASIAARNGGQPRDG
jgi:hypothetical protein